MTTPSKTETPPQKGHHKKSTRERILEAATQVFADYPYHTASIRMIGKAAGIEHPLVNYYFPTKAALFEEVLKTASEKYYLANITWFEDLVKLSPEKGLSLYLDRFLDFALKHPKPLRIITLNLVPAEHSEIIPGYRQIQNLFAKTSHTFTQTIPLRGLQQDIEMLITSFRAVERNNCPGWRWILVRIQGAMERVYRDIRTSSQHRIRANRQARWDNYFFPRPLIHWPLIILAQALTMWVF